MNAMLFDIERNSFVDGPGIRTTVFFKGCNLRCAWCHNPESQLRSPQMMFYKDKCIGCGKCTQVCPTPEQCTLCGKCVLFCPVNARKIAGKQYTTQEILAEVLKDKPYYANSGGGVTFSGGECMLQIDVLTELLKSCKAEGVHTAVDTAGHIPFSHFEKTLPYTDLFLYDIKLLDNEDHKKYVGVGNELILENLQKLLLANANVWIRIPVIQDINDSIPQMEEIKALLSSYPPPAKIELLPYHAMGENKYRAIEKDASHFHAPSPERLEQLKTVFSTLTI